jgi:hypothetical protein
MSSDRHSTLPRWQWASVLLALASMAAVLIFSRYGSGLSPIFSELFVTFDGPASALSLLLAALAMLCCDRSGGLRKMFAAIASRPGALACATLVIAGLGAVLAYHRHPLSMDEYASYLQAQIFASGHLSGQVPPSLLDALVPVRFQGSFINVSHASGAIAAVYWPSLSVIMAPFSALNLAWLCNPVLTALTVLGLGKLLNELVDDAAARGFALLATVASPVILVDGMSFYGMPLQLFCTVMFTLNYVRGTTTAMLAAGVFLSVGMTTVNPFPVAMYALPWIVALLLGPSRDWRKLGYLIAGALPLSLFFGLGWRLYLMHNVSDMQAAALGADAGRMLGNFSLPNASILTARLVGVVKLLVWAVPGLPVLAWIGSLDQPGRPWYKLLAASAWLSLLGYLIVPFDQGHGWGYRYFHAAWLTLPILAAVALQRLALTSPAQQGRAIGFSFAACAGMLVLALPLRVTQVEGFIQAHLHNLPQPVASAGRQAVFIDTQCATYAADLVQNEPFLRSNEIRLVSGSAMQNARLAQSLGQHPRLVASTPCASRWLLD